MKKYFLALAFSACALALSAQLAELTSFNQQRIDKQKTGMIILGSWALGNIALGSVLATRTTGEARGFHAMNAGWNAVNLGIAALGYWGASRIDPSALDLHSSIHEQYKMQKILLFNAGLDMAYMAGGLYLMERSKTQQKNPEQMRGFGRSIILQGAFLFVFDIALHQVLAADNAQIPALLQGLSVSPGAVGLHWRF